MPIDENLWLETKIIDIKNEEVKNPPIQAKARRRRKIRTFWGL